ncbi:MAG: D-hexose-6-phosphate mutarotase [Rhodocyclales bacterium]|nr:D-hexose-6-phosphate mutarotase [Rhodocyclales bacterium]
MKKPAASRPERLASGLVEAIDFHGIAALRLRVPSGASAVVSALGAQVLSWISADGRERLFLSERARFDGSVPIRGGIPVCFPQFAGLGKLPKHGFVRTRRWEESGRSTGKDYAMASFAIGDDAETRKLWPHAFRAEITVNLENNRLDVELAVDNTSDAPLAFTAALHSYLRVTEVEDVGLEGLYGHEYRDAARGDRIVKDTGTRLAFEGETDRIYHGVKRPLLLNAGNLSLGIDQEGFPDVVVWNPWVERCAALADMAPSDWRHLLCVEAAVARQPVTLAAGEGWYGRQSLVPV